MIPKEVTGVWREIPEVFLTLIFASLFIGKVVSKPKKIWKVARPQICLGQTIAWGQYVIGFIVTLLILQPFFNSHILAAPLIEMSYQGGIGIPSSLGDTFKELGFPEGQEIGLLMATFGIFSGIITGIILVNWGVRTNKTTIEHAPDALSDNELKGIFQGEDIQTVGLTTRSNSIETLTIHICFMLLATGIGYGILRGLLLLEQLTWGQSYQIMIYVPLFPLAMIGGVIVQLLANKLHFSYLINRQMMVHIQNLALDFMIVASISTLSLQAISNHGATFIILALAGFLWNLFAFLVIAPRMMRTYWFERGIVDYGQSMGMTLTGLLLLQVVDPKQETPAFEGFGYKQLMFEPFVGGGIFTALALPLTAQFGPITILIVTSVLMIFWLTLGILTRKKEDQILKD